MFNSQHYLLAHLESPYEQGSDFVFFQQPRNPQQRTADPQDQADGEDAEQAEAQREREQEEQRARELQSRVVQFQAAPATKQRMREYLASDVEERRALVEGFLGRNRDQQRENDLLNEMNDLEAEEASWSAIFEAQRDIRRRIQELQYRAESYIELIPQSRRKIEFENLVSRARRINREDDTTDRTLKKNLIRLVRAGALSNADARQIYEVDPRQDDLQRVMNRHRAAIEGAAAPAGGPAVLSSLVALKQEEARIAARFDVMYNEFTRIIRLNMNRIRLLEEGRRTMETATSAIGISLQEGTVIDYASPDILTAAGGRAQTAIRRIEINPVEIRDAAGRVIDTIPGVPVIYLDPDVGTIRGDMTLGRFKKWVDAMDAVEHIPNVAEAERATCLACYGLHLEPGMELCYPKRTKRDQSGEIVSKPVTVKILRIENGSIYFDKPVEFRFSPEGFDQTDKRSSLTLGEFVKWWHRYEVEKAMSLEELRKLMRQYNEIENRAFGIEAAANPPIEVKGGEKIYFPDERGITEPFMIERTEDGIGLNSGKSFSYPEFFHWVKENHARAMPPETKTPAQIEMERVREREMLEQTEAQKTGDIYKTKTGQEQMQAAAQDQRERSAGSFLNRLKDLWFTTQFLSLKDFLNIGKEMSEFIKRKHDVRSRTRYGIVGARLPWVLGTEFERVRQAASNEEVGKYKEAMEKWGIAKIKKALNATTNKDVAKACILTLVAKGDMRWDDHNFWRTLNRLTARFTLRGAELYIPEPDKMPPGKSGEELTRYAIDALWGTNQAAEWYQENISHFNSHKKNFEYEFKQLENDPQGTGGPRGKCVQMLKDWKAGKHVNAQEYEAMVDGAIKYGKMYAEDKMFFIMAGVLATDPRGETLLHIDRIGELNSLYLNSFPLLDFFTQVFVKDMSMWDEEKKQMGKMRKLNLKDYREMMQRYFPDDFKNCKAGPQFSRFMWEVMLMNDKVRTRISKGIRNAENMDHDDGHLFIPPATPTEIDNLTQGPTGQKKYFTNAGYVNGYAGFGQYMKSLNYSIAEETDQDAKKDKTNALRDAIISYIRYDAILDNRLHRKDGDKRARLDDRHFERSSVVDEDKCILKEHRVQLRNLILEIGDAYGTDWREWLYGKKFRLDQEGERGQEEYERKINELTEKIGMLVAQDNGQRALAAIDKAIARAEINPGDAHGLRGVAAITRPKPEDLRRLREGAVEFLRTGGAQGAAAGHGA